MTGEVVALATRLAPETHAKVATMAATCRSFRAASLWDRVDMFALLDLVAGRRSPWHVRNLRRASPARCVGRHTMVDFRRRALKATGIIPPPGRKRSALASPH